MSLSLEDLLAQVLQFGRTDQLYALDLQRDGQPLGADWLVEAFVAHDALHAVPVRELIVLACDAHVPLQSLLGAQATLHITLADGSRTPFSGLVQQAVKLGSDGALTRYRLRVVGWLWLLSQRHASRLWQQASLVDIIESILHRYERYAAWRWSGDAAAFAAAAPVRPHCCQYRETDLAFVQRLLVEAGLTYRFEEAADAPAGHRLVLIADTAQASACPDDPTSAAALGGAGIRFHAGRAVEEQDAIQAWASTRTLQPASVTVLSHDPARKRAIAASVPTQQPVGGKHAPRLEVFDVPGVSAYPDTRAAASHAELQMQAFEARQQAWQASSTVRTLRAGTRFTLTQGSRAADMTAAASAQSNDYCVLRVTSVGINNLPTPLHASLAQRFCPLDALLTEVLHRLAIDAGPDTDGAPFDAPVLLERARALGYANAFDAISASLPWRPVLADGTGYYRHPRPTALGAQTAIVVGAHGETSPSGRDEIHCDRQGRIRIRFHWQGTDDEQASCWVRVAQQAAGNGIGLQFLPRIGQEVLVKFLENDINQPVVVGALYNGQGEGGVPPTPGGASDGSTDITVFDLAADKRISAQGNSVGGNSPVWHGASSDTAGHRNAAAQWGIRSKEFGGAGYNQLLFDDTDQQGRVQLKSTQYATELNLGHLLHTADNYRGSFRGTGAELRTDAYGALRAAQGLLITSYGIAHNAGRRDPAGDNAAGISLLKQAALLAKSFSQAAVTHQTVAFAAHQGPNESSKSAISDRAGPIDALRQAAAGMVSRDGLEQARQDAAQGNTATGKDKLPHTGAALLQISAKAGLAMTAGQGLQLANGETSSLLSGQDSQYASGGALRQHSGQAIGLLAGAVKAGQGGIGLQLIAAQGPVALQAQADEMKVRANGMINIVSANAQIDWAAAKSISLSTAGGANITIEGGNITVQCPGKITIHASQKKFDAPAKAEYKLPTLPKYTLRLKKRFPFSS